MRICDLEDAIIQLHNIARLIETEIGQGQLSYDIRKCADRPNVLCSPLEVLEDAE